jgi:hypothetical protein
MFASNFENKASRSMSSVYLAFPTYNGMLHWRAAQGVWFASRLHDVHAVHSELSLLPYNFNRQWCSALNGRAQHGFKWFAMLHSDVGPEQYWLDKLIGEAEKYDADLMSAIVPVKSDTGLTSTAILRPGERGERRHYRLSMGQCLHPDFPDTFGIDEAVDALAHLPVEFREMSLPREALVVNTGCMVVRCDRTWAERVWFDDENSIENVEGMWQALCIPEDWHFSRRVSKAGGKVMATRLLKVFHHGSVDFKSDQVWGQARDGSQAH